MSKLFCIIIKPLANDQIYIQHKNETFKSCEKWHFKVMQDKKIFTAILIVFQALYKRNSSTEILKLSQKASEWLLNTYAQVNQKYVGPRTLWASLVYFKHIAFTI